MSRGVALRIRPDALRLPWSAGFSPHLSNARSVRMLKNAD